MPFFLIGKGPDGSLRLLAERVFDTRTSAMGELSRITADPAFDAWDREVLVADLDEATPVLLVRPAAGAELEQPADSEPEGGEAAVPEAVDAAESPTGDAHDTESDEAPPGVPAEPDADVHEDESLAAVIEGLEDDTAESAADLKEALQRTAVSLEAEGIIAPESVGPADEAEPDSSDAEQTASEAGDEYADEPSDAMVVETQTAPSDEGSWPWAVKDEAAPFDFDALEEPGDDDGSLVRAPGDDETMASSRPVILGNYGEGTPVSEVDILLPPPSDDGQLPEAQTPEPEPTTPDTPDLQKPEIPVPPVIPVPPKLETAESAEAGDMAEVIGSMGAESETDVVVESAHINSDFVDLPPVASTDPIDSMTCSDCVYHDTCPNEGQRDPATCGSFQWK